MRILIYIILIAAILYGLLWLWSVPRFPVQYGISFNHHHASSLGLDWKETYRALLSDLQPPYVRVAAMWKDVEPQEGVYDFSLVDFLLDEAKKSGTKVTLVVGQKAPRWPECHVPDWYKQKTSSEEQQRAVLTYIETVVNRYKDHEALEWWQVENEPFIRFEFGECDSFHKELVDQEVALVRSLDQKHPVMITDSGELGFWYRASRSGDVFGTTLYRVVQIPSGKIISYDWVPAGFYKLKALVLGIKREQFVVAELQAEPWFTTGDPTTVSLEEQEKTMNPERLQKHLEYVEHIGTGRAYLWGVEWWYFMKEKRGDERYWKLIQEVIQKNT